VSASFASTRWTLVLDAARHGQTDTAGATSAARALAHLCEQYHPPLLAHALRRGLPPPDAEDAVQGFFASLLRLESLATVGPARGRFRAWLLAGLNHHLSDLRDRALAQKRGSRLHPALDADAHQAALAAAADPALAPDLAFDRAWALALLRTVTDRLRAEQAAAGRAAHFDALAPCLAGRSADAPHAELAARLGLSEPALRVALHRLRQRYRLLLREEIAHTVARPEDIDDELRHLIAALAAP
jgi:DNA-directed RNA polymerase specialized sigma24 family protein